MNNYIIVVGSIIFLFLFMLTILIIFMFLPTDNGQPAECKYTGPIPEPLENEVIGATSDVTLFSFNKNNGFISPCFVYFTSNITYEVTDYGIRLPVGIYNIYVQYLSYSAVDGDQITDRLFRTENRNGTIIQKQVGNQIAIFENNQCLTQYTSVNLGSNANTIRLETAIKGFSNQTLKVDRIEILFQELLV